MDGTVSSLRCFLALAVFFVESGGGEPKKHFSLANKF
jgi:hypothetical protein